jgi:hypothetical protein
MVTRQQGFFNLVAIVQSRPQTRINDGLEAFHFTREGLPFTRIQFKNPRLSNNNQQTLDLSNVQR